MSKALALLDSTKPYNDAAETIRQADRRGVLAKVPRLRQVVAWHSGRRKTSPLEPAPAGVRANGAGVGLGDPNLVLDACEIAAGDLGAPMTARGYLHDPSILRSIPRDEFSRRMNRDHALDVATMLSFLADHLAGPPAARESFARQFRRLAEQFQKIAETLGTGKHPSLEAGPGPKRDRSPTSTPKTVQKAEAFIRANLDCNSQAVAKACDVELSTFNSHISPALKARGFACSRGCKAGWTAPSR